MSENSKVCYTKIWSVSNSNISIKDYFISPRIYKNICEVNSTIEKDIFQYLYTMKEIDGYYKNGWSKDWSSLI